MIRWITLMFFFLTSLCTIQGQEDSIMQKTLIFPKQKCEMATIFEMLEEKGFLISYNTENIQPNTQILLPSSKIRIHQLLIFLNQEYRIETKQLKNNKIVFTKKTPLYTISGFVKEKNSNETLAGANITLSSNEGTFANSYGFYTLSLPEGNYEIEASYIGYKPTKVKINLNQNLRFDFSLQSSAEILDDIIVKPQKNLNYSNNSTHINLEKANLSPVFLGADDAIKRLHYVPGTGGGINGFSDLLVRGGNSNENLVLLDGVPIYNYNHFPGLLSIFNTESLKSIDFYKGSFPARYGGRLSSVTDVKMREGNLNEYHIGGKLNLATLSLSVEGPIIKKRASFIISGRRSWIDAFSRLWGKDESFDFHLQDINLKMNHILSEKDRIYLSFYTGEDSFKDPINNNNITEKLSWGNKLVALRWNHLFSDKIFCNTLLAYSKFKNSADAVQYALEELNFSTNFEYQNNFYRLKLGMGIQKNNFALPIKTKNNSYEVSTIQYKSYMENIINFSSKIYANVGLNYIYYQKEEQQRHHFLQPRIILNYILSNNSYFSLGFSEMQQFIHQLGTSSISLPHAFRLPSSNTLPPSISRLYELNYTIKTRKQKDIFSVSAYYKTQKNILAYKPGQNLFNKQLAKDWKDQVQKGQRRVIGLETSYNANLSPLLLNFSYTFSKNEKQFKMVNLNQFYPDASTPRHLAILNAEYQLAKRHSVALNAIYNEGLYTTLPIYEIKNIDNATNNWGNDSNQHNYFQGKTNNYQLKDNYRIDVGYTFQTTKGEYQKHILTAGIYGLLGKIAPFRVTASVFNGKAQVEEIALPLLLPYFSYTFKF